MIIAFPPCTHLAVSGAAWFEQKRKRRQTTARYRLLYGICKYDCETCRNRKSYRNYVNGFHRNLGPDIHPYMFGDKFSKSNLSLVERLPLLIPTNIVEKGEWFNG